VLIESAGDRHAAVSVASIGEAGIFTRAIEASLLDGRADVAVHSLKDLPTESPAGLVIAAVLPRDDPRDVLVALSLAGRGIANGDGAAALAALPRGARVGTSSLRRRADLLRLRPDLQVADMRGNVPTRVAKAERGEIDAIVLSYAGLSRLGLAPAGCVILDPETMLPAAAQGTIAVQVRDDDEMTLALVRGLDDEPTRICTNTERALLHALEGGCRVPLGALARLDGSMLLHARDANSDGHTILDDADMGPATESDALAQRSAGFAPTVRHAFWRLHDQVGLSERRPGDRDPWTRQTLRRLRALTDLDCACARHHGSSSARTAPEGHDIQITRRRDTDQQRSHSQA
jgi:hydroxymethylbilane synthase